ncbi:MAG: hypothetical protein Q9217_006225, partial [Psora testacea]
MAEVRSSNGVMSDTQDVKSQMLALRDDFEHAMSKVRGSQPQFGCIVDNSTDQLKKDIAVGVARCAATKGIDFYANEKKSTEAFCDILATKIGMAQRRQEPSRAIPEELLSQLHQPFNELFKLALTHISANELLHKPFDNEAPTSESQSYIAVYPDRKALIQNDERPIQGIKPQAIGRCAIEPLYAQSHLVTCPVISTSSNIDDGNDESLELINVDTDDEIEEFLRRLPDATSSDTINADVHSAEPIRKYAFNLLVPDPGVSKQIKALDDWELRFLLYRALAKDPIFQRRPEGDSWFTEVSHLPNGGLEIQAGTEGDINRLSRFTGWTKAFKEALASRRESHKVLMSEVSDTGLMKLLMEEEAGESVIKVLFKLNHRRLKSLVSTYDIKDVFWHAAHADSTGSSQGTVVIDFAFKDVAEEAVMAGMLWSGQTCPSKVSGVTVDAGPTRPTASNS